MSCLETLAKLNILHMSYHPPLVFFLLLLLKYNIYVEPLLFHADVNKVSPSETEITTDSTIQAPATPVEHKVTSNIRRSRRETRLAEKNSGKENVFVLREADPYEAYARTDRPHTQQPGRKQEWNIQRPSKPFVPASERYPVVLQRHRQESRMRRQMELMTLVERNMFSKTPQQDPSSQSGNSPPPPRPINSAHQKVRDRSWSSVWCGYNIVQEMFYCCIFLSLF